MLSKCKEEKSAKNTNKVNKNCGKCGCNMNYIEIWNDGINDEENAMMKSYESRLNINYHKISAKSKNKVRKH